MKKKILGAILVLLGTSMAFPAYAAGWQKDPSGWRWQRDDGTFVTNGWEWLDGNQDHIAERYYFDKYGYILRNTETPDGFKVTADGSWIQDGVVQSRRTDAEIGQKGSAIEGGYANAWLGYRIELPAPASFLYGDKIENKVDVMIRPLGETDSNASVAIGFEKTEGLTLEQYTAKILEIGQAAGGEMSSEAGLLLGDGHTYTKTSNKMADGILQDCWFRIDGDYCVYFVAEYSAEGKAAVDAVMAAVKPY